MKFSARNIINSLIIVLFYFPNPSLALDREPPQFFSHSHLAQPNYDVVYPQFEVSRFLIKVTPETWQAMLDNMIHIYGPPNKPIPNPFSIKENPSWFEAEIHFNGKVWQHVGIRYKGNSSLIFSWMSGGNKMPFKVDFDQFEKTYPDTKNQRFYGFKQLSLGNSLGDSTYLRDRFANNFFAQLGLPASKTAFYNVVVDYGLGERDLGIYTAIEVVDDTVIPRHFGSKTGNIYEGDGPGVTLQKGTFSQINDSYLKENNQSASDWSDIENLYRALHDKKRLTQPDKWRANFSKLLDVNSFLKWLAASTIIAHWDTYGAMTHNFYLYNDPKTNKLSWISWDHNFVLGSLLNTDESDLPLFINQFYLPPSELNNIGVLRRTSFDKSDVNEHWPLIRFLMDDPIYFKMYNDHLNQISLHEFIPAKLEAELLPSANVISNYLQQNKPLLYDNDVEFLFQIIEAQAKTLQNYLAQ